MLWIPMEKDIRRLYRTYWKREHIRLTRDAYHSLELNTTLMFLRKYLPRKGLVLDAGTGGGAYALRLAKVGYDVVMQDISRENLANAEKEINRARIGKRVKGIVEGSITDLSGFRSNMFDAVLCLGGPLSLVYGKNSRRKAISELVRVAKKGAPIFISVMNRFGSISLAPTEWPLEIKTSNFASVAFTGEDRLWIGKYYCHYFSPEELEEEFRISGKGADALELVGLEGLATPSIDAVNRLAKDRKAWGNWVKVHNALCTNPIVVGVSAHILLVARKKR